jgi:CRP-like cAMP-binding protein
MRTLLSELGTFLTTPEEEIIKQGDEASDMFFIIQGDCVLNIVEDDLKSYDAVKVMVEGDHIGEIGLIYKCKRTASVISRNYNTLAKLGKERFRSMCSQYPEFYKYLLKCARKYKYQKKTFIQKCFKKIEFI